MQISVFERFILNTKFAENRKLSVAQMKMKINYILDIFAFRFKNFYFLIFENMKEIYNLLAMRIKIMNGPLMEYYRH